MNNIKASELADAAAIWKERGDTATYIEQLTTGGRLSFHIDHGGTSREFLVAPNAMAKLKEQILADLHQMVEDCDKRLARMGVDTN